jgi:hypothetical protein
VDVQTRNDSSGEHSKVGGSKRSNDCEYSIEYGEWPLWGKGAKKCVWFSGPARTGIFLTPRESPSYDRFCSVVSANGLLRQKELFRMPR